MLFIFSLLSVCKRQFDYEYFSNSDMRLTFTTNRRGSAPGAKGCYVSCTEGTDNSSSSTFSSTTTTTTSSVAVTTAGPVTAAPTTSSGECWCCVLLHWSHITVNMVYVLAMSYLYLTTGWRVPGKEYSKLDDSPDRSRERWRSSCNQGCQEM